MRIRLHILIMALLIITIANRTENFKIKPTKEDEQ